MTKDSFVNVSIILPAINETFSFEQTVDIILRTCERQDLCELIAVVCKRTTRESLDAIEKTRQRCLAEGVPFILLWQTRPYAGGACQDAIDICHGSHLIIMSTDLETDPNTVHELIAEEKRHPLDITTASRWMKGGSFSGYDKKKEILNFIWQHLFSVYYGVKMTDMTYGFRIFPTKLMQSIAWEEMRHPFFIETALKPVRLGVKMHEIPTRWVAREEGESQNTFLQTFAYLRPAVKIRFYGKKKILKRFKVIM